jgi:hypothetical protein
MTFGHQPSLAASPDLEPPLINLTRCVEVLPAPAS